MLVVNLFGAPGSGKSTGAAYIFSKLKMLGVNAELVTEYAKDKVWEENEAVFKNQAYIFGKQYFRMSRLCGKVDVVVTDSPLLLSSFYNSCDLLGEEFDTLVNNVFKSFDNINVFIYRVKEYNTAGRFQSEKDSDLVSESLGVFLTGQGVACRYYPGDISGYDCIVEDVVARIKKS